MNKVPDDYFNNGHIEMARFGSNIVLKNNMSAEQSRQLKSKLKKIIQK